MKALITAKDVTISYDGKPAVENVSFEVRKNENFCLVGANGSGKSTLLMGILGLLKLDHGHIDVTHGLKSVSYLAQIHTTEHDFPATAWEIVLSGTQVSGKRFPFYTKSDRENARASMAMLKIEELKNTRIGDMSGGQQQRVLIARALARKPELLILDEPCSALDPNITEELYALFDKLKRELDLTMLISTHDWPYVRRAADRVLELNRKVLFSGPPKEWLTGKEGGKA